MRKLAISIIIPLALSACQSEADKLIFAETGTVFINGDSLCFGQSGQADMLSYYYLEEVDQGMNTALLNSTNEILHLNYPDTCFKVQLRSGVKYGVLYIMNDIKYSYDFGVNEDGTIARN